MDESFDYFASDGNEKRKTFVTQTQQYGETQACVSTQTNGETTSHDPILLPVQISEILACRSEDNRIHYGKHAFGTFRVCGRVLDKCQKGDEVHFVLCDVSETDTEFCEQLKVIVFPSEDQPQPDCKENDIVVAIGKIKFLEEVVSFIAFGVIIQDNPGLAEIFDLETQLAKNYYTSDIPARIKEGPCPEFEGTMFSNLPIVRENRSPTTSPPVQRYPYPTQEFESRENTRVAGQGFTQVAGQGQGFNLNSGKGFTQVAGQGQGFIQGFTQIAGQGQGFTQIAGRGFTQVADRGFTQFTGRGFTQVTGQGQQFNPNSGQQFSPNAGQKFNSTMNQTLNPTAGQSFNPNVSSNFNPTMSRTLNPRQMSNAANNTYPTSANNIYSNANQGGYEFNSGQPFNPNAASCFSPNQNAYNINQGVFNANPVQNAYNANQRVFNANSNQAAYNFNPNQRAYNAQIRPDNYGLTGIHERILNFVRENAGEMGIHLSTIAHAVGSAPHTFHGDLQYLVNEGIIFNTVDDDHFAAI